MYLDLMVGWLLEGIYILFVLYLLSLVLLLHTLVILQSPWLMRYYRFNSTMFSALHVPVSILYFWQQHL